MNFKGNALTVFFSFVSILLLAQTTSISKISVKWDERDEEKVLSMDESFLLEDGNLLIFSGQQAATNGGLVSIGGGKQFQLSILDKERNIVKTESYKPGSICGGCNVGQPFKLGDRYLVSMIPDKDRNNPMIFEINMATLEISDTKKNLESFEDGIDQTTLTLNKEEIGFHLRGAIVKNKSELFYLTLRMYDTNLNAVLDQEIEIPFKKAELLSYDVDREGNVYVLVAIYHKGRDDKGKKRKSG